MNKTVPEYQQFVFFAQIELLLNHAQRFYNRQFLTRKQNYPSLTDRIDQLLEDYFNSSKVLNSGVPTVHYLADQLHMTASYLSDLLRNLTGQNTQQIFMIK